MAAHLTYPPEAFKAGRSGQVVVQFVVDEHGRTRDVEVVRTSDHTFDAVARHVVIVIPWWTLGVDKGQPVRVRCTLPIIFTFPAQPLSHRVGQRVCFSWFILVIHRLCLGYTCHNRMFQLARFLALHPK